MSTSWRNIFLICTLMVFIGCAGGKASRWGHFHGDLSSRGLQMIDSGFALSSSWISHPYKITSSSLVIGRDLQAEEVIYVGTTDAMLIAIKSKDGSEKWKRSLGSAGSESRIVSSPSVSDKGDIYVITNRRAGDGRTLSTLHKVNQFSNPKWSYAFPDNGFTTGSPKVIASLNDTLIFVYLSLGTMGDFQGELFVLRDAGNQVQLLDRRALGTCDFEVADGGSGRDDILDFYEDTWDLVSNFPIEFDKNGLVLPDRFVDPTVAVVTGREKPLIAIADNLCSIGAFEWDGSNLSVLWRQEHGFDKHSSAAVSSHGLMVFGRQDGKVPAYDVETGVKMWEYDAGQAVLATPAAPREQFVFVVSKDHLQVVNTLDGTLVQDDKIPRKLPLLGATHSSPAVTANRVYVSTFEMLTVTWDLKTRGHDTHFHGNGLSSVAVGRDGAVYGVAVDGTIRKYAGTD